MPFPDLFWIGAAIPLASLFAIGLVKRPPFSSALTCFVSALLIALFAVSHTAPGHAGIFQALRNSLPLLVMIAAFSLMRTSGLRLTARQRLELFLLSAVTLFGSLIQFPYSGGFYFFYAAPLGVLLGTYIVAFQPHAPRPVLAGVLCLVVAFLVLRMHHPNPAITGGPYAPHMEVAPLQLERCHLTVSHAQARLYNSVIGAVRAHSGEHVPIYAAPDCPEIYFLSGRKNPTRSLYDFFQDRDAAGNRQWVDDLDRLGITVVVLKQVSEFSAPLDPDLVALLEERFPHRECFASGDKSGSRDSFVVLWRS
jgi:hypothetical protein